MPQIINAIRNSETLYFVCKEPLCKSDDVICRYERSRWKRDLRDHLTFVGDEGSRIVESLFTIGSVAEVTIGNISEVVDYVDYQRPIARTKRSSCERWHLKITLNKGHRIDKVRPAIEEIVNSGYQPTMAHTPA